MKVLLIGIQAAGLLVTLYINRIWVARIRSGQNTKVNRRIFLASVVVAMLWTVLLGITVGGIL